MLRYVLLALMSDGRPAHGYALMKAFNARSGVRLSIGNIYRELQQLRASNLIAAAANPAGADPRRCPYVITDAGRASLKSWLMTPAESLLREPTDPLLYRLALLGDSTSDDLTGFLDEVHAELCSQRKSLERQRALMTVQGAEPNGTSRVLPLLLGRRAKRLAADIELVEEARTVLSTMRPRRAARIGRGASRPPSLRRARSGAA